MSDLHSKTDLISSLENDLEKTSQALKQNKELEDTVTDLNSTIEALEKSNNENKYKKQLAEKNSC